MVLCYRIFLQVKIYVRRGGPNYQEGLKAMRLLGKSSLFRRVAFALHRCCQHVLDDVNAKPTFSGESLGVPIHVYGPDTHVTAIVPLALGLNTNECASIPVPPTPMTSANSSTTPTIPSSAVPTPSQVGMIHEDGERTQPDDVVVRFDNAATEDGHAANRPWFCPFDADTRAFVYGLQPRAIQGMLDFDYSCKRSRPSVAAMIYPFGGHHIQKFYWGTRETLLPVYTSVSEAVRKHPDVDVIVNFASSRSVYSSTLECFEHPGIRAIALIAEGVPERQARELLWRAKEKNVLIIGPATVGGIKPGCFRIGNSGG